MLTERPQFLLARTTIVGRGDLVEINHRLLTEKQILRDYRSKYSKLQDRLQDVTQLSRECGKF